MATTARSLEDVIGVVIGMEDRIEKAESNLQQAANGYTQVRKQLEEMGQEMTVIKMKTQEFASYVQEEKRKFGEAVASKLGEHQAVLQGMADACSGEFQRVQAQVGELAATHVALSDETKTYVDSLTQRMSQVEKKVMEGGGVHGGKGEGKGEGRKGLLPEKKTKPDKYDGQTLKDWRGWVEDVEDHVDGIVPGMREFLKAIVKLEEPATPEWRQKQVSIYGPKVMEWGVELWRLLKTQTEREAKTIVRNVKDRDGYMAWQNLATNFDQCVEARMSIALSELGD